MVLKMSNPVTKAESSKFKDRRKGVVSQKENLTKGKKKKSPEKVWHVYYKPEDYIKEILKITEEWVVWKKFASKDDAEKWIQKSARRNMSNIENYKIVFVG